MLYGLCTRNVLRARTFFNQDSLTTVTRGLRLFQTSLRRHENYSKSWLAKASNVISNKGEGLLKSSFKRTSGLVQAFDDLLGFSEVQEAQSSVKKAENDFMNTRSQVQATKMALYSVQERLREVRQKLDRVPRDDERYLALATEEHKILVEEKKMKTEHESLEALERDQFALLSGAVRNSHERERLRAERTKHWSVIGSIGGAALGKVTLSTKFPPFTITQVHSSGNIWGGVGVRLWGFVDNFGGTDCKYFPSNNNNNIICTFLSIIAFSTEVLIALGTLFHLQLETGPPFYVVIQAT